MKPRLFLVLVLLLTGAGAFRAGSLAVAFRTNGAFALPFALGLSLVAAAAASACAIWGSLKALAAGRLRNPWTRAFLLIYSVSIANASSSFAWQPLGLSLTIGSDALRLGPNFVGLGLLFWYWVMSSDRIRGTEDRPVATGVGRA